MIDLPRGVSGYRERGVEFPTDIDIKRFKSLCYGVATILDMTGLDFEWAYQVGASNYHTVTLQPPHAEPFKLFCNATFPLIAFARIARRRLIYFDLPEVAAALEQMGPFTVLSADYLEQAVTPELLSSLSEWEFALLRYWRPRNMGDVLFNDWD